MKILFAALFVAIASFSTVSAPANAAQGSPWIQTP